MRVSSSSYGSRGNVDPRVGQEECDAPVATGAMPIGVSR
jgi:hypothetical protein